MGANQRTQVKTIRIYQTNPPGVASQIECRVVCRCGWFDKTYQHGNRAIAIARHHNDREHGGQYYIRDERIRS